MDIVQLIGRILFALIFVGSGIGHLTTADASAGYAESKGVPSAKNMVLLSGVAILAGGIGIILGIWMDLAAYGMAAYAIIAAVMMHKFWTETDEQTQQVEMAMFMKNLSIAGGAVVIASIAEGAAYTLTDSLFG